MNTEQQQSWRDRNAWLKNEHIDLKSPSDEACKLYDCALTQLVTWRELAQYDGLEGTVNKMIESDPDFFLGHVLNSGIQLIGSSLKPDPQLLTTLESLKTKRTNSGMALDKHELLHHQAVIELWNGNVKQACDLWESVLIETPSDMMAIKFAHDSYFYTGLHAQMRDSLARVIPKWKQSQPLYSYLHGMHSFGLVQSGWFDQGLKAAEKSLSLGPIDANATHAICHYYEYKCDPNSGLKFLEKHEAEWAKCNLYSMHHYWHRCLFYLEMNDHQAALDIFDTAFMNELKYNRVYDMVDFVSLLYRLRLDMCSEDLSERWLTLKQVYKNRFEDHGYLFNDSHLAMLLSSCPDDQENRSQKDLFVKSMHDYLVNTNDENNNDTVNVRKEPGLLKKIYQDLGVNVIDGLFAFDQGDYDRVVELLYPKKYDLIRMGGSNAQRDLFTQILIQSALRSKSEFNQKLGIALLHEREALKPNTSLTKRIRARFTAQHELNDLF